MISEIPDLFTRALLWLSQELKLSRQQVVTNVLGWLDDAENPDSADDFPERLLKLLGLRDRARLEAEDLLCRIMARGITRPRPQRRWEGRIARQTDWGATTVGHMAGKRGQYMAVTHPPAPDRETISALATLGATWVAELKLAEERTHLAGVNDRRARLIRALSALSHDVIPRAATLTEPVLIRLEYLEEGADLRDRLHQTFLHRLKPLSADDARMLCALFTARASENVRNHAYLLEVISAIAILRVLVDAGWKLEPGRLEVERRRNADTIRATSGFALTNAMGWRLSISKPAPGQLNDATLDSRRALFERSPQPLQPDILMQFSGPDGENFWIVGDAKCSGKKGDAYARTGFDALMKYIVAYAPKIGLCISGGEIRLKEVNGQKMPAGLLFTNAKLDGRIDVDAPGRLVEGFSIADLQAVFPNQENSAATQTTGHLHTVLEAVSGALVSGDS